MTPTRTVLGCGTRIALVALIVGAATGCVKRHDELAVTSSTATAPSAEGAHGSTAGTVHESDRVRASGCKHGRSLHHASTTAPHGSTADRRLAAHVQHALAANKLPSSVGVTAHHGVVTLTGHVHSAAQKRKAAAVAAKVAGVKHVHNQVHAGH